MLRLMGPVRRGARDWAPFDAISFAYSFDAISFAYSARIRRLSKSSVARARQRFFQSPMPSSWEYVGRVRWRARIFESLPASCILQNKFRRFARCERAVLLFDFSSCSGVCSFFFGFLLVFCVGTYLFATKCSNRARVEMLFLTRSETTSDTLCTPALV